MTWFDAPRSGLLEPEHDRDASPTMAEKVGALSAPPAVILPEAATPDALPQKVAPAEPGKPTAPVADPLAALMALSEAERIALFT